MDGLQERNAEQGIGSRVSSDIRLDALVTDPVGPKDTSQIQRTLASILNSVQFRSSKQCQDLLRYVIEQSLNDQGDLLRERVIGAMVFGRRPDYDTANDPIVRARMAEVRKRLAQYYQSSSFDTSQTLIEVPPGHYRAIFRHASAPVSAFGEEVVAEAVKPPLAVVPAAPTTDDVLVAEESTRAARSSRLRWWMLVSAGLVMTCAAFVGVRFFSTSTQTAFDQFWIPVLKSPMPVIVYTGTNVVYRFSPEFLAQYRRSHHLENNGPEFGVDLASLNSLEGRNLQASTNAYVTTGDVSASTAITSVLVQHRKPYELRFAQDISPGDLHSEPIVLIGAFNNPWTLNITKPLRFSFSGGDTIKDASDPKRSWTVQVKPDGSTTDDYAIISRLLSVERGQTMMIAAGIGQYGTQAAAEFLSSPEKINAFARSAPAHWNSKNLQIVIHVKVVDDVPASEETVATYQW
jgi:hypothetical protein